MGSRISITFAFSAVFALFNKDRSGRTLEDRMQEWTVAANAAIVRVANNDKGPDNEGDTSSVGMGNFEPWLFDIELADGQIRTAVITVKKVEKTS